MKNKQSRPWMWGGHAEAVGASQRYTLGGQVSSHQGGKAEAGIWKDKWTLSRQTKKWVRSGPLVEAGEQQREIGPCKGAVLW